MASPVDRLAAQRLRVAAMIHTRTVSGPARQLAALAQRLDRDGVEMLIIVFQRRNQPLSAFVEYLQAAKIPHAVVTERHAFDFGLVEGVKQTLSQFRPHIVQTHGYKPSAVAAALRLRRAPWKWIAFWHGTTTENLKVRGYHQLDAFLVRRADRLVVMSDAQRRRFADLGETVSVIPNAVVAPSRAVSPLALPADAPRPVLGVIGRLSSEKGVDVFLHAAARLVEQKASFSAVVVGDGPDRAALVALRDELGLTDRVHFLGHLADPSPVYAAIDLLVIPSRSEGLPNVLLEALAADKPVAATSVGAIPDVIDSPQVGVVVPPESPGELAAAMLTALRLRDDSDAARARRRVVDRFSLDRRVEAHRRIYAALCPMPSLEPALASRR